MDVERLDIKGKLLEIGIIIQVPKNGIKITNQIWIMKKSISKQKLCAKVQPKRTNWNQLPNNNKKESGMMEFQKKETEAIQIKVSFVSMNESVKNGFVDWEYGSINLCEKYPGWTIWSTVENTSCWRKNLSPFM